MLLRSLCLSVCSLFVTLATALVLPSTQIAISADDNASDLQWRIPTVRESAAMARRIFRLERIGTLSTIFPSHGTTERRPSSVEGMPLGLMEYFADCEPSTSNPTILAVSIASSIRNTAAGSNITLSLRWHPPVDRPYSAAEMPRFALFGYLEEISQDKADGDGIAECFATYHPDSVLWMPGNKIHYSYWARLVVTEVYWFGGFGDRAYIGWIPLDVWTGITEDEIKKVKLPGEEDQ